MNIDFLRLRLVHDLLGIAFIPLPAIGIDVFCLTETDERAAPGNRTMFGMGLRPERIIRTGDHKTPKGKGTIGTGTKPRAVAGKLGLSGSGTATKKAPFGISPQ